MHNFADRCGRQAVRWLECAARSWRTRCSGNSTNSGYGWPPSPGAVRWPAGCAQSCIKSYVDRLRSEKKEVSLEERESTGSVVSAAAVADPVEQGQYERIAQSALETALGRLPPRQKLLLDFYYFHGLTLREAAALVGVHEATASRELDRARTQLRQALTSILKQEHRLEEDEVRRCLYQAAQGSLEIRRSVQDRGTPAVQK